MILFRIRSHAWYQIVILLLQLIYCHHVHMTITRIMRKMSDNNEEKRDVLYFVIFSNLQKFGVNVPSLIKSRYGSHYSASATVYQIVVTDFKCQQNMYRAKVLQFLLVGRKILLITNFYSYFISRCDFLSDKKYEIGNFEKNKFIEGLAALIPMQI